MDPLNKYDCPSLGNVFPYIYRTFPPTLTLCCPIIFTPFFTTPFLHFFPHLLPPTTPLLVLPEGSYPSIMTPQGLFARDSPAPVLWGPHCLPDSWTSHLVPDTCHRPPPQANTLPRLPHITSYTSFCIPRRTSTCLHHYNVFTHQMVIRHRLHVHHDFIFTGLSRTLTTRSSDNQSHWPFTPYPRTSHPGPRRKDQASYRPCNQLCYKKGLLRSEVELNRTVGHRQCLAFIARIKLCGSVDTTVVIGVSQRCQNPLDWIKPS